MSLPAPVSVVIASYQEGPALRATVTSVRSDDWIPAEIIVVDDGSTDGSCEGEWPDGVRVLARPHRGIAAARNDGAEAARHPHLVFLDAHCEVDSGWLRPLVDALDRFRGALVGPAVRDASDRRFVGAGARIVDPLFRYRWCAAGGTAPVETGLVPGGCFAVDRELFRSEGGFAAFEAFGLEDVELSLRWWTAGRPLIAAPASSITHRFRVTPGYRPDRDAWLRNVLRTALRHLDGERLRESILACSQLGGFNSAIAAVLSEPQLAAYRAGARPPQRPIADYLARWSPTAFAASR